MRPSVGAASKVQLIGVEQCLAADSAERPSADVVVLLCRSKGLRMGQISPEKIMEMPWKTPRDQVSRVHVS